MIGNGCSQPFNHEARAKSRQNLFFEHDKNGGAGPLPLLFSPFFIGPMTLKNRFAMAPMGDLSSTEGALRQEFCDFILARAQGGVGMIILPDAGLGFTNLDIEADPERVKNLVTAARDLARKVHDRDVRIGVQLHHSGRQLDFPTPGCPSVGPSPIPWSKRVPIPKELSVEEIERLTARYVEAALLVKSAEFDFVEIKICHGYLLSSFISPHSNKRSDPYGGSLRGEGKIAPGNRQTR
jgi:2,4-dienoyl-CoA reductase-like NADH-dependent reductase (Old Yellow Enzyme family)